MSNHQADAPQIGDKTHRLRQPNKPQLEARVRPSLKLTDAQKADATFRRTERQNKAAQLEGEIKQLHDDMAKRITELSQKFDAPEHTIKRQVYYSSQYNHGERTNNMWCAETSLRAEELNAIRGSDDKLSIAAVSKIVKAERDARVEPLSIERIDQIKKHAEEKRKQKTVGTRAGNKEAARDVSTVSGRVCNDLKNLTERANSAALLFIVRGHTEDTFEPAVLETENALGFLEDSFNMTSDDFVRMFEMWATDKTRRGRQTLAHIRNQCASMMSEKLQKITGVLNLNMNYVNYDEAIVLQHSVRLTGWPEGLEFVKPSKICGLQNLLKLRDALRSGTCQWERMDDSAVKSFKAEMEKRRANGEQTGRPRKERSDKNTTRKRKSINNLDNGSTAGQTKRARKAPVMKSTSRSKVLNQLPRNASFKSREFISDDESVDDDDTANGGGGEGGNEGEQQQGEQGQGLQVHAAEQL